MPRYALSNHDHNSSGKKVPAAGLSDFDMEGIESGQVMQYDAELQRFRPATITGGPGGPAAPPAWGTITGTMAAQTDLAEILGGKANVGDLIPGPAGADGTDGYTPIKGVDYFDGTPGTPGADGYTPVKGVDYFDGADGADSVVPGPPGANGADGYTPVKGVDYFDGADGAPGADSTVPGPQGPAGGDAWTVVKLASDFTSSLSSNANVTGLYFTPAANKTYAVYGGFLLRTATATVGARPGVAWPTVADGGAWIDAPNSVTAAAMRIFGARSTQNAASTGLADTTNSHYSRLEGIVVSGATPSGNFQITLASETAGTNVSLRAGSYIMFREL